MRTFEQLKLIEPLCKALSALNYESPTPIQAQSIPHLLDGRNVIGCAQTGTGKTAAFTLPILQHITTRPKQDRRVIRALVLSPTRELAAQIADSFKGYGRFLKVRHQVIFGGVNENPQIDALRRGTDVLVATPGRLVDLMSRGFVDLSHVEFFVLDEADRMLDMGFMPDIRRVLRALPDARQNLLFSATMSADVMKLSKSFGEDSVKVEVTPENTTVEAIDQRVMFVEKADKVRLLVDLLGTEDIERAIVFSRTKHGADKLTRKITKAGFSAVAIHGNKSQNQRTRALNAFRRGDATILVATDVVARGIDVEEVSHVFNYDLPNESESYVHRIGRTGRAGRMGSAIAFCSTDEGSYLRDIEKLIGQGIPVVREHNYHSEAAIPPVASASRRRRRSTSSSRQRKDSAVKPRRTRNHSRSRSAQR